MEFGPCSVGMEGPSVVTFQEIESWSRMTKTELPGWEVLLLRQLSKDYVSQYMKSRKDGVPCPGNDEADQSKSIGEMFRRFK